MSQNLWYKNIKKELKNLPGEQAHIEMIPYRTPSSLIKTNNNSAKQSAVLCLLFKKQNIINCILMQRTIDGGKHSGQISFPGGKKDTNDSTLQNTALRETFEEIGLAKNKIVVLGELTPLYIPVSQFFVQPFLGIVNANFEFKISEKEVQSAFYFNVKDLNNPNLKINKTIKNHNNINIKNVPCFLLNNKTVWGATALILNELKIILTKSKLI